jgi:hypothetical protein
MIDARKLKNNFKIIKMGFNTSVLLVPKISKEPYSEIIEIFNRLGYSAKQRTDYVSYDDSHQWITDYKKAISVSIDDEEYIIFDDYISELHFSKKLLEMSKEVQLPIFYATQSETTEIWIYDIYQNGKYFNVTIGYDIELDLSREDLELLKMNTIPESPELSPILDNFRKNFRFDLLYDKYFWDFEITQTT